jgi:hypothetical protein
MSDQDQNFPFGHSLHEMDTTAFLNMRAWLQAAVEAKGAKMDGGGVGFGQADIDIELEGCRFNVSIKPLPKNEMAPDEIERRIRLLRSLEKRGLVVRTTQPDGTALLDFPKPDHPDVREFLGNKPEEDEDDYVPDPVIDKIMSVRAWLSVALDDSLSRPVLRDRLTACIDELATLVVFIDEERK